MSVLPIVDRELRVTARRSGTYWMRFWAALAMLVLWLILLRQSRHVTAAEMGHHVLNALGILALVFSMLAGVFLTSDCLSEERREGTLGLLFLTNLKAYDVVLGKLAAHSLHAIFSLLAVLPILGLAILLGGVTGPEFARLALVFITTLFFSLGISLAVSAAVEEAKQALGYALLLIVILAAVLPGMWWLLWALFHNSELDFFLFPSPGFAYFKSFDMTYRSGTHQFWYSIATLFSFGLAGIIRANLVLPRAWQERRRTTPTRLAPPSRHGFSPKAAFKEWPSFSLDEPLFWLSVRDPSARRGTWKAILFFLPLWVIALLISLLTSHVREAFMMTIFISYGMHFIVKVMLVTEASRRMNQDRRSGAWELLLVTPLAVPEILQGQRKALWRHFRGVLCALSMINVLLIITVLTFGSHLDMREADQFLFTEMFLGGIVALYVDFGALSWIGMWRGLTARQHHRAVLGTLLEIMSPPLFILFLMIFLQWGPSREEDVAWVMGGWFAFGAAIAVLRGLNARKKLDVQFRAAVLQRA